MRIFSMALALLTCLSAHGAGSLPSTPETVVHDFYATLLKPGPRPLSEELTELSVFLSQDLNHLIVNAQTADAAYLRKYPTDKGILGNGTCFFYGGGDCSFTSYRVMPAKDFGGTVKITVQLTLVDDRPGYPSAGQNRWRAG